MSLKTIIIFLIILAVVIFEGYLIFSYIENRDTQINEVKTFCNAKCKYNDGSAFWEFSGDYATKGFTTQNECFAYCSNVKQGFTASLISAILNFIGNK